LTPINLHSHGPVWIRYINDSYHLALRPALNAYPCLSTVFLFIDPAPTAIYTLSLHDALPISERQGFRLRDRRGRRRGPQRGRDLDRKSTRLNSSHGSISYAVFCLKKKKKGSNTLYCNVLCRQSGGPLFAAFRSSPPDHSFVRLSSDVGCGSRRAGNEYGLCDLLRAPL